MVQAVDKSRLGRIQRSSNRLWREM